MTRAEVRRGRASVPPSRAFASIIGPLPPILERMDSLLDRQAFSVDGAAFTWRDVQAAARRWGEWDRLSAESARGGALVAARAPADDAVNAAARDFRYARDLVSGDEMRAWLESHAVTVGGGGGHVR